MIIALIVLGVLFLTLAAYGLYIGHEKRPREGRKGGA